MKNWFECKVSYEKILENGTQKKVTESYLADALSFTEAEARITEEINPYITGEFTIAAIKRTRFSEVFFNDTGDLFFKAKIQFVTLDEKRGKEKHTGVNMLIQANDIDEAQEIIKKNMQGTLGDYVIEEVKETKIADVFQYQSKNTNDDL
jgi:hypothetical protein